MKLRLIEEADLEAVRLLRNANGAAFFNERSVSMADQRRWYLALSTKPVRFYVIEEDDHVVGTISATQRGSAIEIGNIIVDAAYRRRGLMRKAVAQVTSEPGEYICRVLPDNQPSLSLFEHCGFAAEYVQLRKTARSSS